MSFAETNGGVRPCRACGTSSVIEYDAPAPNKAYRAHAAPAPMVEYDAALMWRIGHMRHLLPWSSTTLQHRLRRTGYTRHLLPWMSTTLQLHVRPLLLGGRASRQGRACSSGAGRGGKQSRSRSCRLSRKSSIFQKSRLSKAPRFGYWSRSRNGACGANPSHSSG